MNSAAVHIDDILNDFSDISSLFTPKSFLAKESRKNRSYEVAYSLPLQPFLSDMKAIL